MIPHDPTQNTRANRLLGAFSLAAAVTTLSVLLPRIVSAAEPPVRAHTGPEGTAGRPCWQGTTSDSRHGHFAVEVKRPLGLSRKLRRAVRVAEAFALTTVGGPATLAFDRVVVPTASIGAALDALLNVTCQLRRGEAQQTTGRDIRKSTLSYAVLVEDVTPQSGVRMAQHRIRMKLEWRHFVAGDESTPRFYFCGV